MTDTSEIARIVARLTEAQQASISGGRYYLASCDHCGWVGSSEECGTDTGGDDSDVYCPTCNRSGADCGGVVERHGNAITAYLEEQG